MFLMLGNVNSILFFFWECQAKSSSILSVYYNENLALASRAYWVWFEVLMHMHDNMFDEREMSFSSRFRIYYLLLHSVDFEIVSCISHWQILHLPSWFKVINENCKNMNTIIWNIWKIIFYILQFFDYFDLIYQFILIVRK